MNIIDDILSAPTRKTAYYALRRSGRIDDRFEGYFKVWYGVNAPLEFASIMGGAYRVHTPWLGDRGAFRREDDERAKLIFDELVALCLCDAIARRTHAEPEDAFRHRFFGGDVDRLEGVMRLFGAQGYRRYLSLPFPRDGDDDAVRRLLDGCAEIDPSGAFLALVGEFAVHGAVLYNALANIPIDRGALHSKLFPVFSEIILSDVERRLVRLGAQTVFSCGLLYVLLPDRLGGGDVVETLAEYPELFPNVREAAARDVGTFKLYDVPVLNYKNDDFEKFIEGDN